MEILLSKITRTVVYPFTGDQPVLTAEEHRTVPSREDVVAFFKTHERVTWNLTEILEIPWQDIDIDALTPTDIYVAESAMLVEGNGPDYVANLLEYFKADQDVCDFVMMWAIEEWKHYYALADYIAKVRIALAAREAQVSHRDAAEVAEIEASIRRALGEEVRDVREASIVNWGIPMHYLPAQVVANTTFQEFVTAEFYRHHARQTKEPVLAKLELLMAKDETRHEMFYEARVKDCLDREPELMPAVIESLKEFGMPGAYLLGDYEKRRAAMEAAAFPTLAAKKDAFVRIFAKMARVVGHDNAMRVFTEGNYLSDGQPDPSKKKMRPEMITRLVTRKLAVA
jgi:hypothetical protein